MTKRILKFPLFYCANFKIIYIILNFPALDFLVCMIKSGNFKNLSVVLYPILFWSDNNSRFGICCLQNATDVLFYMMCRIRYVSNVVLDSTREATNESKLAIQSSLCFTVHTCYQSSSSSFCSSNWVCTQWG